MTLDLLSWAVLAADVVLGGRQRRSTARPVAVCIAVTDTYTGPYEIALTGSDRLDPNTG